MRWTLKPKPDLKKITQLSEALGVEPIISSLLLQRGIENYEQAKQFFRPDLEQLHDPYLMKDMDKAVARIEKAVSNKENILVYGDYDVDGTSSVALISSYLLSYYENIATYIPDRYDEGYGISFKGIDFARDNNITLVIALDCGIKAIDKIDYASENGVDFIICDHHLPGSKIPKAIAVLDPKRTDCEYPFKELCGCGVGFKLVQALASNRGLDINDLLLYLDLVATAIGADIVPMVGENRVLAYFGLQVINSNPRPGFKAIINQLKKNQLTITDVVFIIAPRINAAGRMKHGNHAVELMTEQDLVKAKEIAKSIELFNSERRDIDKRITDDALEQIELLGEQNRKTTVVYDENWHKGVIGIVASRLIETYYRPTLVFTKSGNVLAASARSVSGFDIYNALTQCSDLIEQFGGHKYAAGLTLAENKYDAFKNKFEEVVANTIDSSSLTPQLKIDCEIDLNKITPKFYRILSQFAPFGPGNMRPVFMSEGMLDSGWGKLVGEDKSHLRLTVNQHNSEQFVGIGFGMADKKEIACSGRQFKAIFSIDENEWHGVRSLQLKLKDIKA